VNAVANKIAELNVFRPQAFHLELERSESGEVVSVATVFLRNRRCPWRCIYCDLWKDMLTETVPLGAIPTQIDFALEALDTNASTPVAKQIKLYNAGSFFDLKAIPPEDLPAIAQRVAKFDRVIVECHPALVGSSAVTFRDLLAEYASTPSRKLEVAMGLEIADDEILARLNRQMTLDMFARAARFLREHEMALRTFVIVKPPFVRTDDAALHQAQRSIDFAFDCGSTMVSLIPARFGTSQLEALAKTGDFHPPELATMERALAYGINVQRGRVFADWWDLEKIKDCDECFAERRARLQGMNREQRILPAIRCESCHDSRFQNAMFRTKS
jgi:radical SAM enzyme (TIGR01210 family)